MRDTMKIDLITPPKRFTGLHAHSSFSTFDGLGYPKEHIDFVLCEAKTMNPILGIELDDSSHERQSR